MPDPALTDRPRLIGVAYRMLGTLADAEDAVQETYARWLALPAERRAAIEVPAAWLTRVLSRVCLDLLDSARVRRERYVGEWLPEPVRSDAFPLSPEDRAILDDSVSTALLVVLESLTPAERVCFVLHDVFAVPFDEIALAVGRTTAACRQLATSARRHVTRDRHRRASTEVHDSVTVAFGLACAGGSLSSLIELLDPSVVLRSDGGGRASAATRPVRGPSKVARFLLGLMTKNASTHYDAVTVGDGLAFTFGDADGVRGLLTLRVGAGRITDVWIIVNPDKLTQWRVR